MRFFSRLLIVALLVAVAGPFFLTGPSGDKLMNLADLIPSVNWGQAASQSVEQTAEAGSQLKVGEEAYYKWKDDNGVWQFSNTRPPEHISSEVVVVNPQANVIQSLSQKDINKTLGVDTGQYKQGGNDQSSQSPNDMLGSLGLDGTTEGEQGDSGPDLPVPTSVPMDKIPQLIEKAKQVQGLTEQRADNIDRQLQGERLQGRDL